MLLLVEVTLAVPEEPELALEGDVVDRLGEPILDPGGGRDGQRMVASIRADRATSAISGAERVRAWLEQATSTL